MTALHRINEELIDRIRNPGLFLLLSFRSIETALGAVGIAADVGHFFQHHHLAAQVVQRHRRRQARAARTDHHHVRGFRVHRHGHQHGRCRSRQLHDTHTVSPKVIRRALCLNGFIGIAQ